MPRNANDKRPINRWAQLTTFNRRLSNSAATVILALLALPQLQTMLGLMPADIRAVVGPCYDRRMEEYRVGLGPKDKEDTFHGIVWPLLGAEDEATDAAGEIEAVLRETGVKEGLFLDHSGIQ